MSRELGDVVGSTNKRFPGLRERPGVSTPTKYPHWPAFFYSTDLSQFAAQQPLEQQWWIGDWRLDDVDMEDEVEDSAYAISVISVLSE